MDFRFYLSLFLRRLHWFLLILVICTGLGIVLARELPTVYRAEALLVVESEQIPDELAASTVQTQAIEQLQIIQQRILSRDTLLEMANRLQIYAAESLPGRPLGPMNADEIVEDLRERITIVTSGGPVARGPVEATLVRVGFEAPTAALSAAVANDVVTLILREDVAMRTGVARQTLEFFEQEVARLDQELARRNAAILDFQEKNRDALNDSLEFRRSQLVALQERLVQLTRDEAELRDRRARMVRLHDATGAVDSGVPVQSQTPEQRQLQTLRDQMTSLQAVLSPENPKVKLLAAQITSLEGVVAGQLAAGGTVDGSGEVMSAYDIQLADVDGQLKFLADLRAEIVSQQAALEVTINATPANVVALDTLQRDYANVRAQYDDAVAKRARAETGDVIEALSKGQRISVIEQAVAPRDPASPNRPLIAVAGVGGGFVLGLALVLLIELLRPGIRRPADLTARLGITPFATLPFIDTLADARRRRRRTLGLVMGVAVVLVAAVWAINTYYMPLDEMVAQLVQRLSALETLRPALA